MRPSSIASVAIAALVVVLAAACSGETTEVTSPETTARAEAAVVDAVKSDAKIAAVLVRADWCSSCKIIEPKLDVVRAGAPIRGVSHLTLDYTARDEEAFYAAADAAGVGEAIRGAFARDGVTTGIVLLVDVASGAIVGDLRKSLSSEELAAAMSAAGEA